MRNILGDIVATIGKSREFLILENRLTISQSHKPTTLRSLVRSLHGTRLLFFLQRPKREDPPPWTAARPNFVRGNPSGPDWIVEKKGLVSENFPMAGAKHQKFILDPKQASLVGFQYPGGGQLQLVQTWPVEILVYPPESKGN